MKDLDRKTKYESLNRDLLRCQQEWIGRVVHALKGISRHMALSLGLIPWIATSLKIGLRSLLERSYLYAKFLLGFRL